MNDRTVYDLYFVQVGFQVGNKAQINEVKVEDVVQKNIELDNVSVSNPVDVVGNKVQDGFQEITDPENLLEVILDDIKIGSIVKNVCTFHSIHFHIHIP